MQTQRKASQIAHHQKCHKHTYKTLNFTTFHPLIFRTAKLQKKVEITKKLEIIDKLEFLVLVIIDYNVIGY